MLLVKVAILGLLRLPSVTVNDVVYTPREAPVTIPGPVRVATSTLTRSYAGNLEITAENGALQLFLHIPEEDLVVVRLGKTPAEIRTNVVDDLIALVDELRH